jgi:hypothetical protein
LGRQAQGPVEGHPAQESQVKGRVAQGCQETAAVADNEDEKDDDMGFMLALAIGPQPR